ncbi:hypothetical protein [Roseovarius sp. D22-M7]|uniref:hypothetical protein n=1 Tax=Roseovarius sp. D22-M7 TaxID=3127116 RepID=UPI0030100DB9
MIQKVDTFEHIRVEGVKIDMESLVTILESTGESSISLKCDDTIYESLDEIKSNKSAISIPFKISCGETTIEFDPFAAGVFGRSSSSHRQKALARELRTYVPVLSKFPLITFFVTAQLIVFGLPRIFAQLSFDVSTEVFGFNLQEIALFFMVGLSVVALFLLYYYHWTRTKIYYSRSGFLVRNADNIAVGLILMFFTALFYYFFDFLRPA